MNSYEEYTRKKRDEGDEYEDFVIDELYKIGLPIITYKSRAYQYTVGENKMGIEIKFDERLKETGNLYIEIEEKSHPDNEDYVPSGIYRNDNSWLWAIGNREYIYIFGKKFLKLLHASKRYQEVENKTKTSKAFLLPTERSKLIYKGDAEKYALKKIICKENEHNGRIKGGKIVRFGCTNCGFVFDVSEIETISNIVICPKCNSNACNEWEEYKEFKERSEEADRYYKEEWKKIFRK